MAILTITIDIWINRPTIYHEEITIKIMVAKLLTHILVPKLGINLDNLFFHGEYFSD